MRKLLKLALVCALVLGVLGAGGFFAHRAYDHGRQVRLLKQTRDFLDQNKSREALLVLKRAFSLHPNDIEASRLMARLSEMNRSPETLLWRSRVVELNPGSTQDRLLLARTALTFRDYRSATNALEGVDPAGKKTAAYHIEAGAVAAAANQLAQAEAHFDEAARLEPQNTIPQLNLAVIRLQGTNAASRAGALSSLQQVSLHSTNLDLRCQALRELLTDAMRHKEAQKALGLSDQLLQDTNSVFNDRFRRLESLQLFRKSEFKSALIEVQREATSKTNSIGIYELAEWEMKNIPPADALSWLATLPLSLQTNQPLALLIADGQATLQQWGLLKNSVERQNWAYLEFMRHAYRSRALRGLNTDNASKVEWELALEGAKNHEQRLVILLRLSRQWGWQSESEDLLWNIISKYPTEGWAVRELTSALFTSGRTHSLLKLWRLQSQSAPSDLQLKRDLAMLALLLDAEELKPHQLAKELYEKSATNPAFASSYAFSLFIQKKYDEALKVIQKLTPNELQSPAVVGYYGLILQATGDSAKARVCLDAALKTSLLPQERKLFQNARSRT